MTHNEFVAIVLAVVLLAGGEAARPFLRQRSALAPDFYAKQDSLFFALSRAQSSPDTAGLSRTDTLASTDSASGDAAPLVDEMAASDGIIDINRASMVELTRLPGIGPRLAQRIVEYRKEHGPFRDIQELQNVSGIGPRKLQSLMPLVRL